MFFQFLQQIHWPNLSQVSPIFVSPWSFIIYFYRFQAIFKNSVFSSIQYFQGRRLNLHWGLQFFETHIRWASNTKFWETLNFMHSFHLFVRNLNSIFPQPLFTSEKRKKTYFCRNYFYWKKEIWGKALIKQQLLFFFWDTRQTNRSSWQNPLMTNSFCCNKCWQLSTPVQTHTWFH